MTRRRLADELVVEDSPPAVVSARWMGVESRVRARRRRRLVVRGAVAGIVAVVVVGIAAVRSVDRSGAEASGIALDASPRTADEAVATSPRDNPPVPTSDGRSKAPKKRPAKPIADGESNPAKAVSSGSAPDVAAMESVAASSARRSKAAVEPMAAADTPSARKKSAKAAKGAKPAKRSVNKGKRAGPAALTIAGPGELQRTREDGRQVEYAHRSGRIDVDIVKDGRRWRFVSGFIEVEVLGTRFSIDRQGNEVRVAVRKGRVAVRRLDDRSQPIILGSGTGMTFKPSTPQGIWTAVDRLRRARRFRVAAATLETIVASATQPAERDLALYTLGVVHADDRKDSRAARRAFEAALAGGGLTAALKTLAQQRLDAMGASTRTSTGTGR